LYTYQNDAGAAEPDDESLSPPIDVERNESSMTEHISRLVRVHLAGLYRREIEYPVPAIALADNELNIFKQASLTRADRWACVDAMRKVFFYATSFGLDSLIKYNQIAGQRDQGP
jgi:hypothetical protein